MSCDHAAAHFFAHFFAAITVVAEDLQNLGVESSVIYHARVRGACTINARYRETCLHHASHRKNNREYRVRYSLHLPCESTRPLSLCTSHDTTPRTAIGGGGEGNATTLSEPNTHQINHLSRWPDRKSSPCAPLTVSGNFRYPCIYNPPLLVQRKEQLLEHHGRRALWDRTLAHFSRELSPLYAQSEVSNVHRENENRGLVGH